MKITQVYVDGERYKQRLTVVQVKGAAPKTTDKGFNAVIGGVTGGAIAKYAWSGFQATNTLTHEQLVAGLVKNGLAPQHAPSVADAALEVIRAEPTKVLLVAVSAGGGTWALLEVGGKLFGKRWSRRQRIVTSLIVAALAAGLYVLLRWLQVVS